jgi:cystathionine beta-lyase/cystathionine gamma-synthase
MLPISWPKPIWSHGGSSTTSVRTKKHVYGSGVARRIVSHHHRHEKVEKVLAEALRTDLLRETAATQTDRDVPMGDVISIALDRLKPSDRAIER